MSRQLIDLEDLKAWRAAKIRQGNCNYDDMIALNAFINTAEIVPDRPQGEWIFDPEIRCSGIGVYSAGYVCSVCGKDYFKVDGMRFCPSCGARMKGADDTLQTEKIPAGCNKSWSAVCTFCDRYFSCDYLSGRQTERSK